MRKFSVILACLSLAGFVSCRHSRVPADSDSDILLTLCDSSLRIQDVLGRIPAGLEKEDSAEMFDELVASWARGVLFMNEAESLDPAIAENIEKKVNDYRAHLIADAYLRQLDSSGNFDIPEDSVKSYYSAHLKEFILQRPLIKGVFLKIDAASPSLEETRKLMNEGSESAVEKIERYAGNDVITLEAFQNRWIDISMAADLFPARPTELLKNPKEGSLTETMRGQTCSMLKITDLIPAGEQAPYEYARSRIFEIFRAGSRRRSEKNLLIGLLERANSRGKYSPGSYDLLQLMQKN